MRLLEERLVVVEPHAGDAHQLGRDAREAAREHEAPDHVVVLPEVRRLQERSSVGAALGEWTRLAVLRACRRDDRRTEARDLVRRREPAHDGEAVAAVALRGVCG